MGLAIGRTQLDHDIMVYDMTGFLRRYPGGFARVRRNCGKVNCTWEMRYKGGEGGRQRWWRRRRRRWWSHSFTHTHTFSRARPRII